MLFAAVFRAFNVHTHIVTTKEGRKHVQHSTSQRTKEPFVLQKLQGLLLCRNPFGNYVLVIRSVQITAHILEGEEKSYDENQLTLLTLPKCIISLTVNSDQKLNSCLAHSYECAKKVQYLISNVIDLTVCVPRVSRFNSNRLKRQQQAC